MGSPRKSRACFRSRGIRAAVFPLIGIILVTLPVPLLARSRAATLFYYVERPPALVSALTHLNRISIIAPQVFVMDREGFVFGEVNPELLKAAREQRVAVMPLVINPGFNQEVIHAVLDDPSKMQRAIRYLLYYTTRDGYWGIQLDFENIHASYRHRYNLFVEEVARQFHRRGRKLSVAVVAKHSDRPEDYSESSWAHWAGVFDYATLSRAADFLSVMTYDQHSGVTPPGPVAGVPWMERVLAYAVGEVPAAKLSLGIPLYFRSWNSEGGRGGYGGFPEVVPMLHRSGVVAGWDAVRQVPWFRFQADGVEHEVWYEDVRSFQAKLELVHAYKLRGFSAWVIGQEDPRIWTQIAPRVRIRRPPRGSR
ncbi:MAG: glycosyl hydrolase family 18 protein [Candidatus Methylomirabilales bacterium]